jgi:serine/threonine-protein kinase
MSDRLEHVQRAFATYVVERELGSGGMATVYLAHDKKHDRKVAIKVLHAELAAVLGAERFLQEIRVTANLQHPHILGLIDSGVIGDDGGELRGRPYYVMPFVEGESLRQRLDKEQQLPVSDSVRIATEVASALDYAHRHNVIHRDIKPENILLHDGTAIVADFGIALALTQAGGSRMTQTGLSLGTPSYMSPEQAMGERTITARSDIYSLGAVTYEMLSGEPPFTGPTVQAVVARVMTEEPRPLTAQRRSVPPYVAAAVSHALEKVPADRFATVHEFAEALNNPSFTRSSIRSPVANIGSRERKMLYAVTALAILISAVALWARMGSGPEKEVVRYGLVFDSTEVMVPAGGFWGRLALSADGSRIAYISGPSGHILVRAQDQLHAIALPGTERAQSPFFSPDGKQIGFITGARNLRVVSLDGDPPISVTDSLIGVAGASWGRDGFIYCDGFGPAGLVRVEARAGAVPKWFTRLDTANGETDHLWPDALPNGKGVVFTVFRSGTHAKNGGPATAIAVAEIPSGKHRVLLTEAMYARYAPSGHLLYVTTDKTLMVVGFDENSMKLTGEPTALVEGMRLGVSGSADLGAGTNGKLIYVTGGAGKQELVWVTRDGKAQPVDPDWQANFFREPAISPDGKRLAVAMSPQELQQRGQIGDIWIKQLDRGPSTRLTLNDKSNATPSWTPDGRSVTYTSNVSGSDDLWTKPADGSGQTVLQLHEKRNVYNARWSPDGKWLVFRTNRQGPGAGDILGFRPGTDTAAVPLVATNASELSPVLSPDGRWLAYASNESGQYETYVVPFPNTRASKWPVSIGGGTEPLWSHNGRELFFRDAAGNLVAVEVKTNPTFSIGRSTVLFPAGEYRSYEGSQQYAVSADDSRFLMIRPVAGTGADKLIVVQNWVEELRSKPAR